MATFVDPVSDAAEAHEGLRGLTHATRTFENPADTYRVFGEVIGVGATVAAGAGPTVACSC